MRRGASRHATEQVALWRLGRVAEMVITDAGIMIFTMTILLERGDQGAATAELTIWPPTAVDHRSHNPQSSASQPFHRSDVPNSPINQKHAYPFPRSTPSAVPLPWDGSPTSLPAPMSRRAPSSQNLLRFRTPIPVPCPPRSARRPLIAATHTTLPAVSPAAAAICLRQVPTGSSLCLRHVAAPTADGWPGRAGKVLDLAATEL